MPEDNIKYPEKGKPEETAREWAERFGTGLQTMQTMLHDSALSEDVKISLVDKVTQMAQLAALLYDHGKHNVFIESTRYLIVATELLGELGAGENREKFGDDNWNQFVNVIKRIASDQELKELSKIIPVDKKFMN